MWKIPAFLFAFYEKKNEEKEERHQADLMSLTALAAPILSAANFGDGLTDVQVVHKSFHVRYVCVRGE